MSRTLFVGGIPHYMTEEELHESFRPYGPVQSIIFQRQKKHAFVKMYTRRDSELIKEKFEELNRTGTHSLRARWGVGFGPRDCCHYESGVSVIPISRLTEADKRWILTAEYGGTGGAPLRDRISIEEPDIEIGAGVSSKTISKRMPTNSSRNGPKSSYDERERERERERDHRGNWNQDHRSPNTTGGPTTVPPEIQALLATMQAGGQAPAPAPTPAAAPGWPNMSAPGMPPMVGAQGMPGMAGFPQSVPPPAGGPNANAGNPALSLPPQLAAFLMQNQQNQQR
jgi:protein NRD1